MRKIGLGLLLLVGLSIVPVMAPAATGCTRSNIASAGTTIQSNDTAFFVGVDFCGGYVSCSASHAGPCALTIRGTFEAKGSVGVAVFVDNLELSRCSFQLGSCSATSTTSIAPGDRVYAGCDFIDGVAVAGTLTCSWSIA